MIKMIWFYLDGLFGLSVTIKLKKLTIKETLFAKKNEMKRNQQYRIGFIIGPGCR